MLRCIFCVLSSMFVMAVMLSVVYGQGLSPVQGQSVQQPKVTKTIKYKEKSYYDFEDTLINGNLRKPDGSFIFRKNQSSFSSALNLKRSFIPELKESSTNAR